MLKTILSLFSGIALAFALAQKYVSEIIPLLGGETQLALLERASWGLTSQLLLLESLLPGCRALPGSRAGGAGHTQAPCGHLVVGSIKFVGGMRKDVLAKLAEKIAACGVDDVGGAKGGAAMG